MQMSKAENRDAAIAAECEIEQILCWFSCDSGIDKGVPGKLWDGDVWHRPVMDKSKAYSVMKPFFGFLCG